MSISPAVFEQVRERAGRVCEYCGVSEVDSGGLLTIDHFRPRAHSGDDSLDNLVYACFRCNIHKHDYWADQSPEMELWNPRVAPASAHLLELEDGRLIALTDAGHRTIDILRLNRPLLIAYRHAKQRNRMRDHVLARITEVVRLRRQVERERRQATTDQRDFLEELRDILALLERIE